MNLVLRPMICKKCKLINNVQELLNTANCIQNECDGTMEYIDNEMHVKVKKN